jgi:hypothetical protein
MYKTKKNVLMGIIALAATLSVGSTGHADQGGGTKTSFIVNFKVRSGNFGPRNGFYSTTVCTRTGIGARAAGNRRCENTHPGWDACKFHSIQPVGGC